MSIHVSTQLMLPAQSFLPSTGPRAVKMIQRYQLNHSHENAYHNEAWAEDPLAMG